jgi:glutamyl-tRNA reductase
MGNMGNRQHTGDPHHSVEAIRAHEVRRLLDKLCLSPEQSEAIENLSHSLVEELVHGPIAETVALVQDSSRSRVSWRPSGRHCMVEGVQVAGAQ